MCFGTHAGTAGSKQARATLKILNECDFDSGFYGNYSDYQSGDRASHNPTGRIKLRAKAYFHVEIISLRNNYPMDSQDADMV